MDEAELRVRVRDAFQSLNYVAEQAIRRELAESFALGHSERLQFEVCPHYFGIKLVQTEEEILSDSIIPDAVPQGLRDAAEATDLDVFAAIEADLFPWFAERWEAAGGPQHYQPAYAFFHGGLDEPRYDLQQRRWCEVSEVWPTV